MALWSGATMYERHINAKRELWVPKGFSKDDLLYCWKVKYDLATGKHFFVNLAGFGKSWRLPDIYDARVQEQMRQFAESVGSSVSGPAPLTSPPPQQHQQMPPQSQSALPPQQRHQSTHQRTGQAGAPGESKPPSSRITPARTPPPEVAAHSFRYGDDSDWGTGANTTDDAMSPASPPPRNNASTALRESEEALRSARDAERSAMSRGVAPPSIFDPLAASGVVTSSTGATAAVAIPQTLDVVERIFERSRQLEASYAHHVTTQQERLDSLARSHTALESERQAKDQRYVAEMAELARLEAEQAERIAREAAEVRVRLSQSPTRAPSQSGTPASATPLASQRAVSTGDRADRALVPASSDDVQIVHVVPDANGSRALVLAMEQLDHERALNTRLAQQLEERDRLLMQHMIADAERERREIALRIRMVEAMAAYRRERDIDAQLEEERREAEVLQRHLGGFAAANGGGGGSGSGSGDVAAWSSKYIPRHPLAGDDAAFHDGDDGSDFGYS